MEIDHVCANPACDCHVANAGDYCSDACRHQHESGGGTSGHCACGHGDCGTSTPGTRGVPNQNGDD